MSADKVDQIRSRRAAGELLRAIAELCQHVTAAQTRYPGTDLLLRYELKNRT